MGHFSVWSLCLCIMNLLHKSTVPLLFSLSPCLLKILDNLLLTLFVVKECSYCCWIVYLTTGGNVQLLVDGYASFHLEPGTRGSIFCTLWLFLALSLSFSDTRFSDFTYSSQSVLLLLSLNILRFVYHFHFIFYLLNSVTTSSLFSQLMLAIMYCAFVKRARAV